MPGRESRSLAAALADAFVVVVVVVVVVVADGGGLLGDCQRQTSGGRESQGRKYAACRQGCRVAESLVGRGRALVASANLRAAHVSCDCPPSSKMSVGAVRM